jgi:hypothetical protein
MEQSLKPSLTPKVIQQTIGSKEIPELRLSGIFLMGAGFKAGDQVLIEIRDKELIIKAL